MSALKRASRAPEVLQVSAMDCGPAVLRALALGHGIDSDLDELRRRCNTDVDGTSIEALAQLAAEIGLETEERVLPADLALADPALLPAIGVLRLESGEPHFVLLWRRRGAHIEVMDPAAGRLSLTADELAARLWRHETLVETDAWLAFTQSDEFTAPLTRSLRGLGIPAGMASRLVRNTSQSGDGLAPALLDAATRYLSDLVRRDRALMGRNAQRLLDALLAEATTWVRARELVPNAYWSAWASDAPAQLHYRGAVLLTVEAVTTTPSSTRHREHRPHPGLVAVRRATTLLHVDGGAVLAILLLFAGAATAAGFIELLLFRSLVDLSAVFAPGATQFTALGALIAVIVAGFLVRQALSAESFRLGRIIETELRVALIDRLPDIADEYFATRSTADLAERTHALQLLRLVPGQLLHLIQAALEPIILVLALAILDFRALLPGLVGLLLALALASLTASRARGAEQRQRGQAAALAADLLDMLRGLVPIRLHRAEPAFLARYDHGVTRWMTGARRLQHLLRATGLVTELTMLGISAVILTLHFAGLAGSSATDLLFAYWTLRLPLAARALAGLAGSVAIQSNVLDRLEEPLAHATPRAHASATPATGPVAVSFSGDLVRNGTAILEGLALDIPAGQHVAIVGPSGAGKSSLIGLCLDIGSFGGSLMIDGHIATPDDRRTLAARTAWIDPAAQLYDASLAGNLAIGLSPGIDPAFPAFLAPVIDTLPEGEATRLGEGALLLSGGEAQRLRIARALNRPDIRLALADEPFRGLDRAERRRLMVHLRSAWTGTTFLCATHDIADTLDFDRVLVLDGGRIVADGRPQDLLRHRSLYLDLLRAEQDATDHLWTGGNWRRFRLAAGHLDERR